MKKTCAQLKDAARDALLGHYSILIATMIVTEIITLILQLPFSQMLNTGLTYRVPSRVILGYAGMMIVLLVSILINVGISYIHLQISRNRTVHFSDLLYGCKYRPDRYIGYGILLILIIFACITPGMICILIASFQSLTKMLLLSIVGIVLTLAGSILYVILMLGFSQAIYLLIDHASLRVVDAMGTSMNYMKGNKWRLFKLYLSFIGWMLLALLTLGIGYLWIQPYCSQSITQFYLDVTVSPQQKSEYSTY